MSYAPIALFTYNRPYHTRKTVETLQRNKLSEESDLIVFSDGPKEGSSLAQIQEVRNYLKTIGKFKSLRIVEREVNLGLSVNILDGVQQVISEFGKVIVLEDDLETSPFFLEYMNQGLNMYESAERVISIMGYVYPMEEKLPETFFLRGADCFGWATWKRGWDLFQHDGSLLLEKLLESKQGELFDFDGAYPYIQMLRDQIAGKTNSWAIRWYASAFLANKFTLYPGRSLVLNIGGDGSGTNHGVEFLQAPPLSQEPVKISRNEVVQNVQAYQAFAKYFRKIIYPNLWNKIRRRFRILLNRR